MILVIFIFISIYIFLKLFFFCKNKEKLFIYNQSGLTYGSPSFQQTGSYLKNHYLTYFLTKIHDL